MTGTFTIDPHLLLFAAALNGDNSAVQTLANSPEYEALIISNRIAPGLAIRAATLHVEGPQLETWRNHMRGAAVMRMRLEATRREVGGMLAAVNIPWAPLKGMGLDQRIYQRPEERITTDLDILISKDDLAVALDQLTAQGWRQCATTERRCRYVHEEGYAWQLHSIDDLLLEVHFRLWGGVQESLAGAFLERAHPEPEFGPTALRLGLADSYLVAAVHLWQAPPPRYLALWWDLHRMASIMDGEEIQAAITRALDHGLQAFVAFSAATAADLWGHPRNRQIANDLARSLRPTERWAASTLQNSSPATASLGVLSLGRLLANRPSRSGWRAVIRQIWAHPGSVDAATPDTWSWPRRRLTHVARKLHLTK